MRFLLTPLREGRHHLPPSFNDIYIIFLLTPLREGRPSLHRDNCVLTLFLLTPLREGRHERLAHMRFISSYFYSRPYARGDALQKLENHQCL